MPMLIGILFSRHNKLEKNRPRFQEMALKGDVIVGETLSWKSDLQGWSPSMAHCGLDNC